MIVILTLWFARTRKASMPFEVLTWPAYSPDLNPIDNLWKILQDRITSDYAEFIPMPSNATFKAMLVRAAIEVWEQEVEDNPVDSMPRHIAVVIQARWWYTKY